MRILFHQNQGGRIAWPRRWFTLQDDFIIIFFIESCPELY